MAKKSDNHDWDIPEDGDDDYEVTFSTFFDQIDRDVEIKDTDANKANYDPKTNAKFLATDTENVYLGDGSNWNKIASSGKNPTVERLDSTLTTHATDISDNYTLESGEGAVVAGPLTGSGSISGNGRLAVIQEAHQFTDTVDAQNNDLTNVGALDAGDASVRNAPMGDDDALRWQEGTERGNVISNTTLSGQSDDGIDTSSNTDVTQSFNNAFASIPTVVTTVEVADTNSYVGVFSRFLNKSSTAFDCRFENYGTADSTEQVADYIATEGR